MKLSTKARYAITAMMDLALHEKTRPVTLADISQNQGISLSYLEQLFAKLRSQGLVRGVRGPGGGYRLARSSNDISIAEVVAAINGMDKADCKRFVDYSEPVSGDRDMMDRMWDDLSCQIYQFLDQLTLDQFIQRSQQSQRQEESAPGASTHHSAVA